MSATDQRQQAMPLRDLFTMALRLATGHRSEHMAMTMSVARCIQAGHAISQVRTGVRALEQCERNAIIAGATEAWS